MNIETPQPFSNNPYNHSIIENIAEEEMDECENTHS